MGAKLGIAGLIGLGCVVAAAGGGYYALRSNAADMRSSFATEPARTEPAAPPADVPTSPVAPAVDPASAPTVPLTPSAPKQDIRATPATTQPTPAASASTSSTADAPPATAAATAATPATTNAAPPQAPVAPQAPPPAPAARYDEVTVAADAVLGLQLDSTISTETARVEDRVNARLSRDVMVDGRVAIPTGARLEGVVTLVERGGKFKDRPRLGVAFNTLVLADSTRVAIQTDTIFRDGESPSGQANAKVGGSAVVGAILGAMLGGKKGALVGSTAGAAGGAAAVAAGNRAKAIMTSGTPITARLSAPVTVLIERDK